MFSNFSIIMARYVDERLFLCVSWILTTLRHHMWTAWLATCHAFSNMTLKVHVYIWQLASHETFFVCCSYPTPAVCTCSPWQRRYRYTQKLKAVGKREETDISSPVHVAVSRATERCLEVVWVSHGPVLKEQYVRKVFRMREYSPHETCSMSAEYLAPGCIFTNDSFSWRL